ncbi:MAG TPA: recombinase family protein [Polyangiaceae bacterium]|nr:recombinase family protein [Polyangiaceae bacterium]
MAIGRAVTADAIYARYSSELQNPRSVADQVERLRGEVARHGGAPSNDLVFHDGETSGAIWERPGLQALLRAVEAGRVRRIFCEDVSRISRDPEDQARLRKRLEFHGVQLVTVDGVELDGSSRASLSFGIKAIFAEQYLRDLGDKTRRGLWGNAREGKATGGRTYGYLTADDGRVMIDDAQAPVVRRIFETYARGAGYARIAAELNADGIEPPRGSRRRAGGGWMASCLREMLRNPKYAGAWRFGVREWRRHPDTRRRVARGRADVFTVDRPELAIVPRDLWDSVAARLAEHATARTNASASEGRKPRRPTAYLLSSLLRCGVCGGLMQIAGGSHPRYRCATNKKRGATVCSNALSVRESTATDRILDAIRGAIATPEAAAYIRRRIAERLGQLSRETDGELAERTARLGRVEERIRGIITMQLDGDRSPTLAEMRRDFEAQATAERAAVATLRERAAGPIRLPDVAAIVERVQALDALTRSSDIEGGREALRRYLHGGQIVCTPEAGAYVARAELLPLAVLLNDQAPGFRRGLSSGSSLSCAGRI